MQTGQKTFERITLLPEDREVQLRLPERGDPELVFVDVEGREHIVVPPVRQGQARAAA